MCFVLHAWVFHDIITFEYLKGYLRYETIFCYKVAFDLKLMIFFI